MTSAELAEINLDLCLAFTNTVDWHASDQPEETLNTYVDLVAWAREARLVTESEAGDLLQRAAIQAAAAERALAHAHTLREAIYRIFVAVLAGEQPAAPDLATLNHWLSRALQGARIQRTPDGFTWGWDQDNDSLEGFLGPIARSAGALLTSELLPRLGQCADDRGCGYLFLDTSKNRSRRWCSMENCGNRAKQRRYQQRNPAADG